MLKDKGKLIVVGSGGRLGSTLVKLLGPKHQVVGLDSKQLDLCSMESIDRALGELDYDHLFLAGALTAVDYCESHVSEAFKVNAAGPGRIAKISAAKGAHVTYFSTDMVFGGAEASPYVESDKPDPVSVYGASKLAGEVEVLSASEANLVTRISWLFGPGRAAFPEWIIDRACVEEDLSLPGDKICCPTYTVDLIEWLVSLVFGRSTVPASGIYHLCNSTPCSWLDWGQFCIDTARDAGYPVVTREIKGVSVNSVPAFVAKRPVNSAMNVGKFIALTGIRPRNWTEALRDFVIHSESFVKYRSG